MHGITTAPGAAFDYSIHWPRAATHGVPIVASEWRAERGDLSIQPGRVDAENTSATMRLGEAGAFRIVNRVTLADDRALVRALDIEVAA